MRRRRSNGSIAVSRRRSLPQSSLSRAAHDTRGRFPRRRANRQGLITGLIASVVTAAADWETLPDPATSGCRRPTCKARRCKPSPMSNG